MTQSWSQKWRWTEYGDRAVQKISQWYRFSYTDIGAQYLLRSDRLYKLPQRSCQRSNQQDFARVWYSVL